MKKSNSIFSFNFIKKRTENIDIILKKTKLKNNPDILKQVIKKN